MLTAVATCLGLVATGATQQASAAACATRTMYVVAHADDSLLFLSPQLLHDAQNGACIATVYLTAGDNGWGIPHMNTREAASNNAMAQMAGVADTWTRTTTSANGHNVVTDTLQGNPNIVQLWLRLPDGNTDGSGFSVNGSESLQKLWQSRISTIHPIDGTAGYTLQGLEDTLLSLMNIYQPRSIYTQDYMANYGDNDHSDHITTGYVARATSQRYQTQHSLTAYLGYDGQFRPQNVSGADLTGKTNAFNAYDAVDDVCNPSCTGTQYGEWLKREYVTGSETGPLSNQAPVANAGGNQTVNEGATVTLDGSGSHDPEGVGLTYAWSQTGGPAVTLSSTTVAKPTFTAPSTTVTMTFQLVVNDGSLDSPPSIATITVSGSNQAPVARAGPTQSVATGATATLDGSASSDPDNNPLTYRWTQVSGTPVTLSSSTAVKPTFTAPTSAGSLGFQLVVNDGLLNSAPSTVTVTVTSSGNMALTATATASSADTNAGQGAAKAIDGVVDGYGGSPGDETKEWSTVGGRAGSWLKLTWSAPMTLTRVVLHDRPNSSDQITAGNLVFDTGSPVTFGTLPNDGTGLTVTLPNITTKTLTMNVTAVSGGTVNIGLAEIEAWGAVANQPPVAVAGPDQSVAPGANVTLDGSASSDAEGAPLTYRWTQTGGPAVTLSSTAAAKPTFAAPSSSAFLSFQLVVNDGSLDSPPSNVAITVGTPDHPPVANAGTAQTVTAGAAVTLDGSGSSDPDGDPLTYSWTQTAGPSVTLSSSTAAKPTFTAPATAGSVTFQLVVNDGQVASAPSSVTITVKAANQPPVANAGSTQSVTTGAAVTLDGSLSSDPDGDPLTYSWAQTSGTPVTLSSNTVVRPTFTAPGTAGTLTFQLVVNDGLLVSAPTTTTVTVTSEGNMARTAVATASSEDLANGQGAAKAIDGVVDGYGGTPGDATKEWSTIGGRAGSWLKLTWSSPMTLTRVVLHDRPNDTDQITAGNLVFDGGTTIGFGTLPNNGTGLTVTLPNITTSTVTMNVTTVAGGTVNIGLAELEAWGAPANRAPVAVAGPDQTVALGATVTLDGSASSDPESSPLTYRWTQTSGPAVTLSSTTAVKPTFAAPATDSTLTFQLVVNDGALDSPPSTVTITDGNPNRPPVARAGSNQTVNVGTAVTLDGSASSDPEGSPLTYAWSQTGGTAVTLSSATVAKPTFTAPMRVGTLTFRLVVNDGTNDSLPSSVTVTVNDPNPLRASNVQATNGTTIGRIDTNDTLTLTFSEQVDLTSAMAGWTGAAQNVALRVRDGALLGGATTADTLDVYTTTGLSTPVNLGSVNLKGNYIKANQTVVFNATMTASTVTVGGVPATAVTLRVGTVFSGATQLNTITGNPLMTWTPVAATLDLFGNPCSTTALNEPGTADRDF